MCKHQGAKISCHSKTGLTRIIELDATKIKSPADATCTSKLSK